MFGFLKKSKDKEDPIEPLRHKTNEFRFEDLQQVPVYLFDLGYELTDYGAVAALVSIESGYSPAETASIISLTSFAREIREMGDDIEMLAGSHDHVTRMLKALKVFCESGAMRQEIWENDSKAVWNVFELKQGQLELIDKILSDDLLGKEPVAVRVS